MIEKAAPPRYDVSIGMREREIKSLVRKTVKETLHAELAHLRAESLPVVSKREMDDIMRKHGKPPRRAVRTIRARL